MDTYTFSIRIFLYSGSLAIISKVFIGTVEDLDYTDAAKEAWKLINAECERLRQETGRGIATAEFRIDIVATY
jgi:hypothetical protein